MTSFGPHPAITRKDGQLCCAACDCPFREVSTGSEEAQIPSLEPVDDRPCVPTFSYRFRQRMMPLLTLWMVILIVVTQGPKIGYNRFCWWLFGPDWSSGCSRCDGTGKIYAVYVQDEGAPAWVDCSGCNAFHD